MKSINYLIFISIGISLLFACQPQDAPTNVAETTSAITEKIDSTGFVLTLEKHLQALTDRDLVALESTLSPQGDMFLILPQTPVSTKVSEFMDFHRGWFPDTTWTISNKIIHTDIQAQMGIALVEALYTEPERDGQPYFNRMHVSYALRKMDGQWYVVKDHMCSFEKSTDPQK
ncbi:MAG: nuclear transport factor 2 family protein [Saprospiraceae bacterium]